MEDFNMENYDFDLKRLKVGDTVEGEVVSIADDKTIYVDVKSFTEGTMHLDHYTKDPNVTTFKGLVKAVLFNC